MHARTWRGSTRASDRDAYSAYVNETGIAAYRATPGNRGAYLMTRLVGDRADFLVMSFWDSLSDIEAFAGDDITAAVFYPEDDRYLIARDPVADNWLVAQPPRDLSVS